jgi:hypothetical protein
MTLRYVAEIKMEVSWLDLNVGLLMFFHT